MGLASPAAGGAAAGFEDVEDFGDVEVLFDEDVDVDVVLEELEYCCPVLGSVPTGSRVGALPVLPLLGGCRLPLVVVGL